MEALRDLESEIRKAETIHALVFLLIGKRSISRWEFDSDAM